MSNPCIVEACSEEVPAGSPNRMCRNCRRTIARWDERPSEIAPRKDFLTKSQARMSETVGKPRKRHGRR